MYFLRFITQKVLLVINIITAGIFLMGCTVPLISPAKFWPVSFFGLALPYALFVLLLLLACWLIFHIRYTLVCLIPMIIGWKSIAVLFAFHPTAAPAADPVNEIRVMSYNVRYFKNFDYSVTQNVTLRNEIMSLIHSSSPDILCLQEFYTADHSDNNDNLHDIMKEMKLPYSYFSNDHSFQNRHAGVALFSKYPIIHTYKTDLSGAKSGESAIAADIVRDSTDTFRVITVHLQSIYLNQRDLKGLQKLMHQEDTGFVASRIILGKLRKAFLVREFQAQAVAAIIRQSPYPVIVCGDFNDTPNSYAYFEISRNLQDAFLKRGFGLGRTYSSISPTLRIDYILTSSSFTVRSFRCIHKILSDHYPVISTMSLSKKE